MVDAAGPGRRFPKTEAKKARQRAFLELVEQGLTYTAAAKALGIHITTYERWRREEQAFRTQVDALRASQMDRREDLSPADWDGTFASARKIFFGYDTYWHQREIIYAIERAQPGEVVLILTPPETGKTSLLEDKMCLDLGQNPNKRITYVSESQIRTRKIAGRLQRRMTDGVVYPDFIKRFGPFYMPGQERRGKPWAADCFTVYGSDHDERDYSFEGRGWRSAVAGTRTDEMLIDDVQSLRSLNLTADILERLRQDFFSRPGRNGRICIVMTRVGNNDVPEQLWETGIVTEANTVRLPMVDEQGKSLCPEMWPDEDLVAKRLLVGEAAWFRNYMQQPRLAGNATFTEAMIEGCWDLRARGESELLNRVMMVDPALTGGCAIGVAAYDAERYQMLDFEYRFNMARVEEILVVLERFAEMYKPQDLVVETNAFQRGLGNDERLLAISRRHGFFIRPHLTGSNKADPDLGVARMASDFIRGAISWPGTPEAREHFKPMVDQHVLWRPDVPTKKRQQDLLMMEWFGWLLWQERRPLTATSQPLARIHTGMPYTPTPLSAVRRPVVGVRR